MPIEEMSQYRKDLQQYAVESVNALTFSAVTGINIGASRLSASELAVVSSVSQVAQASASPSTTISQKFANDPSQAWSQELREKYADGYALQQKYNSGEATEDEASLLEIYHEEIRGEATRDDIRDAINRGEDVAENYDLVDRAENAFGGIDESRRKYDGAQSTEDKVAARERLRSDLSRVASGETPNLFTGMRVADQDRLNQASQEGQESEAIANSVDERKANRQTQDRYARDGATRKESRRKALQSQQDNRDGRFQQNGGQSSRASSSPFPAFDEMSHRAVESPASGTPSVASNLSSFSDANVELADAVESTMLAATQAILRAAKAIRSMQHMLTEGAT